jgi:hypothetical protein
VRVKFGYEFYSLSLLGDAHLRRHAQEAQEEQAVREMLEAMPFLG